MRRYKIDLKDPPTLRWQEVIKDMFIPMHNLESAYANAVQNELGAWSFVSKFVRCMPIPDHLRDELRGISDISGVPYDVLLGLNVGYDLLTGCTSAVFRDMQNSIVHARCLDWDMPALKPLTILVDFCSDGCPCFSAVTWAGFVGIYTCISSKGFSVSLNYRKPDRHLLSGLCTKAVDLALRRPCNGFVLRQELEKQTDVNTFITHLCEVQMLSPCYFTIATETTGLVITKGYRNKKVNMISILQDEIMVQTNHDVDHTYADYSSWAGTDPLLISSLERRDTFVKRIKSNKESIKDVLNDSPTTNSMTIFAGIMKPASRQLEFWVSDAV